MERPLRKQSGSARVAAGPGRALVVVLGAGLVLAGCGACGEQLGPPRPRPLPALDGRAPLRVPGQRSPRVVGYRIKARLDDSTHRLTGEVGLTWKNAGETEVTQLPLHLYLNAFKNETSVFMQESRGQHRGQVASTTGWGWIDLDRVEVGGADLLPRLIWPGPGTDETVAWVPLPAPVPPGGEITLDLAFTAQLPKVFARTGYQGHFIMAGQWFPKLGRRDGPPGFERWVAEPLHLNSEFFADFGTYDVALTVPRTHLVAATGVLVDAIDNADGSRTLSYRAEDVHDFAWMADPFMEVVRGTARVDGGEVEVRVVHRPAQRHFARRHLHAAIGTIETMSTMFVPYPWSIMTVIDPPPDAAGSAGGMEYPTLVTTAGDSWWARPGVRLPEYVTVHEVGHNWFQGMLASNEGEHAWLDEGVNDWADGEVMTTLYGQRGSGLSWMGLEADVFRLRRAIESDVDLPTPIAAAARAFVDADSYGAATYGKTMRALRTLLGVVGRDRFLAAMRRYAQEWAFRHPGPADLFAVLEAELGELDWFLGPVFYGLGGPALAVHSAECRPRHPPRGVFGRGAERTETTAAQAPDSPGWACRVVIKNTGTVRLPVDLELRFADGTRLSEHWDDRGTGPAWHAIDLERSSPLVEVELDPEHKIALAEDSLPHTLRLRRNTDASWRAAARAGFWAQTSMSVFGL
ncbi:MAG: M1 family metallopeptidase [Kofleriaceae bacterium]|nr:M1 family metallopeptidase [Kofleriaceae bacterium]